MSEHPPTAILFDWDNTLVDTWPLIHDALVATFGAMEQTPWSFDETRARVKRSMRESFPDLFGARWEEAAKIYQDFYTTHHLDRLALLPGARDVLAFLSTQPVYLAVVSNKRGGNLRKEAEHLGMARYFSKVVGADDAARDKPGSEPVYLALEASGIVPNERVWLIGDTVIDLECAANSGCLPVLYGEGHAVAQGENDTLTLEGFNVARYYRSHGDFLRSLRQCYD